MGRAPCCDKTSVKKGPWSTEEDAKLKAYIEEFGTGGNWIALPHKIGLKRCGKSCRLRWLNYLRPNIKHGGFSEEEDNVICNLYISIGSRWSIIAAQLPGRTDNDIKNYWNTRLKKKLLGRRNRKQSNMNGLSLPATTWEWGPNDAKGMEDDSVELVLSNSAFERIQLHMELQAQQNPFYLYTNPALCPKLHPLRLQEKMVQMQSLQFLNQISSPNLMQNLYLPPSAPGPNPDQPGQRPNVELENSWEDISIAFVNGSIPIDINSVATQRSHGAELQSPSQTNSAICPISSLPSFQTELDDDLMILNNKYESMVMPQVDSVSVAEFDCFGEIDGSKDGLIWWSSNELDGRSAFLNSWDSTSFLG